jgi:hypothetical protein
VVPSVNLGLGSLPPERLKYASGLFNMMRKLGGAVGIAVAAAIINDRTNLDFEHIASSMTEASWPTTHLLATMAARYGAQPGAVDEGHRAALDQLWHLAYREAPTLAFADAFRAIMLRRRTRAQGPELIALFSSRELSALSRHFLASPQQFAWLLDFQRNQLAKGLTETQKVRYFEFLGPIIDDNFRQQPSAAPAFCPDDLSAER